MEQLLREAMNKYGIIYEEMGIDEDHIHFLLDVGIRSVSQVARLLKGYTGKKILQEYPWLKKKYFWGSGLWNPSYYLDSLGRNIEEVSEHVRNQGLDNKVDSNSTSLNHWSHVTGGCTN